MSRDQRLRRLEGMSFGSDAETYKRYARGLSDEELGKQVDQLRANVGEAEYQEMVAEVRRQVRVGSRS